MEEKQMKKITTILLMLAVLALIVALPIVLAEDNETDDDLNISEQTQQEIGAMHYGIGPEIRLLQLEKSITRNILHGETVIAVLKNASKNTTELESILSEMKLLKTEVQEADPEDENATTIFVDLKADAIDLSQEFRTKANELLTVAEANQLRLRLRETERDELKEINDEIKDSIKAFNSEQLRNVFDILGIENTAIIDKYLNGEATKGDIMKIISSKFSSLSANEKKDVIAKLKEEGVKKNIFKIKAVEKARLNHFVRKETRLNKRLGQLNKFNNTEVIGKMQNRIQERLHDINEKENELLNRIQERQQNREDKGNDSGNGNRRGGQ
jgi:hypothetical protein